MIFNKDDIKERFREGMSEGATHMLVVVDRFPFPQEDYVVYVMPGEDVREKIEEYNGEDMQEVIEVYSMKLDIEQQLNEQRAFHPE